MSAPNTTSPRTLAFFGATGGCTAPILAAALRAGRTCTALARTPDKLRSLLADAPHNIPADVIDAHLTIIPGAAGDAAAVRTTLTVPGDRPAIVDAVICGIGSLPKLQPNIIRPVGLKEPNVCETAARRIVEGLAELRAQGLRSSGAGQQQPDSKPLMVAISTTGISKLKRDVPVAFVPFYHYALAVPHKDKRVMEEVVVAAKKEGVVQDFVLVRPSLLTDGESKRLEDVRVGWEGAEKEEAGAPGPAVGYTITKASVGEWIWEEALLKPDAWKGKCVTLTY